MIEGLKIDVPSAELKQLLDGRLKYHQDKLTFYERQYAEMEKVEKQLAEDAERVGKTSNQTPLETLESSIKKHKDQIVYYKFMSEHVIVNETYRLTENDLVRLGVKSDRYY